MNTIKLVIVGLIIAAGAYFVYMYGEMKSAIEIHKENEIKLKDGIASQQQVIDQMQADIGQIKSINSSLREKEEIVKNELNDLESKFKKTKAGDVRDIGFLATQKPEVVEKMINKGSSNVLRCFEISMGAELTKEELEAVTSDKINRECSRIANPNYVQVTPQQS